MSRGMRCLVVWLGATAVPTIGLLLLGDVLAAALTTPWSGLGFDTVLVRGAAVVATLASAWTWLVTTLTVLEAGLGMERSVHTGMVRRIVLTACGVALVSGAIGMPAGAAPGPTAGGDAGPVSVSVTGRLLSGLRLPDRAGIHGAPGRPAAPATASTDSPAAGQAGHGVGSVVVRPGDSLWSIAAATLPEGSDDRQVGRRWREIYAANRAAIGADPDLIEPGLHLSLPAPH